MSLRLVFGIAAVAMALTGGTGSAVHASVPGVIVESARTVADGIRDGVRTLGRTTRAFVLGGAEAAEDAWYDNAELTRDNARRNADRVRAEARMTRSEPDPELEPEPERDEVPLEPDDSYRDY